MERTAWQATVHGVTAVGHNLATKPPSYNLDTLCTLYTHYTTQYTLQPFFSIRGALVPGTPHSHEKLLLNHAKTPGFLAPRGEEFNPGPETRLDRSELLSP